MPNLILQRAALAFPPAWPTDARSLYAPAIVDARGVYVVGCASAVAVFQVFSLSRAWFTINAQTKIAGYAVSSGTLYVQDGPVIAAWDLTYGGCFAGYNIVTKQKWEPPQSDNPWLITAPPASLFETPASAANDAVEFSAPVVRQSQLQGQVLGQVFVLGSDGTIHHFDDALTPPQQPATAKFSEPLRLELVMGELPQPSGDVLCRLYYITKTGAIVAVNGSVLPLQELAGWAAKGPLDVAKVLPLRFIDGLLWGGGILGADLFARTPDPTQTPRVSVAATTGWRDYDVEPDERLALVTDGKIARLVAYDTGVQQPDRWGARSTAVSGQSRIWPGVGSGAARGPALVLEIDEGVNANGVPFRVVLANTVDAVDPRWTPAYPPPATQLDNAIMTPGSFKTAAVPAIVMVRSKAIITRHMLYCVVRATATGPDLLATFALAPERAAVLDRADATLVELRRLARPIRVQIVKVIVYHVRPDGRIQRGDPTVAAGASCTVTVSTFPNVAVKADSQGLVFLDPKYHGCRIALTNDVAPWSSAGASWVEPSTITLDGHKTDAPQQLWIELHMWTGWGKDGPTASTDPVDPAEPTDVATGSGA